MNLRTPWKLTIASLVLICLPPIVFVFIVHPIAELQAGQDGIECIAWFAAAFVMFIGLLIAAAASAAWLNERNEQHRREIVFDLDSEK